MALVALIKKTCEHLDLSAANELNSHLVSLYTWYSCVQQEQVSRINHRARRMVLTPCKCKSMMGILPVKCKGNVFNEVVPDCVCKVLMYYVNGPV